MAEGLIDELEAVEVEAQEREPLSPVAEALEREGQMFGKAEPVAEPSEPVEPGRGLVGEMRDRAPGELRRLEMRLKQQEAGVEELRGENGQRRGVGRLKATATHPSASGAMKP